MVVCALGDDYKYLKTKNPANPIRPNRNEDPKSFFWKLVKNVQVMALNGCGFAQDGRD